MSKHPDAIGFLKDLSNDVKIGWFTMICDQSIGDPQGVLSSKDLEILKAIFANIASYVPPKSISPPAGPAPQNGQSTFLESISDFLNFKRLQDTFTLKFEKQVTLVFGHNGSGKSSICDAMKILANHESPTRPLHNVRVMGTQKVQFSYRTRGSSTATTWSESSGYGSEHSKIKYFDNSIAARSIRENIEPGLIVELSPFNMAVFDSAKSNTAKLKETLQHIRDDISKSLDTEIATTKAIFTSFPGTLIGGLSENSLTQLNAAIESIESFDRESDLKESQTKLADLEKLSSESGQKLLASEVRDFESMIKGINDVSDIFAKFSAFGGAGKTTLLESKVKEQSALNEGLIPKTGTLEGFIEFLRTAKKFCDFESKTDQECPLCRRVTEQDQKVLFKKYFDLLEGQLEQEIKTLRDSIQLARVQASKLREYDVEVLNKIEHVPKDLRTEIVSLIGDLKSGIDEAFNISDKAKDAFTSLNGKALALQLTVDEKKSAADTVKKGAAELEKEKASVTKSIFEISYNILAKANLAPLKSILSLYKKKVYWDGHLPKFTPLLKKITDAEKVAHEELVVSDFHKRLEAEYKNIAEKDMAAFGVTLSKRGSATGVSVLARIGGKEISSILSEGEQRLHSLALFFAELETSKHSVVIFDDPVSSFDYDYISNYCFRLRDFVSKYPDKQVVILTHNWEFFVNLQLVLNKQNLTHRLDVQVMEGCSTVSGYSDKIDDLKKEVSAVLSSPGEPSKAQKEITGARMRRLIESIVNTHVFNNERHQFKQKGNSASEFQKFTKVTPLLEREATELRDLFGKLSISEHDDPRNAYVNTDRAMFQTRYDKLLGIEQAIIARK